MEEQNIPIDINTGKLLEWLISRRHCGKNWHTNVLVLREKINNAVQDMLTHELHTKLDSNVLSGSYINYFHCLKILELLKETESDTKDMFGRYRSQRIKDWQEIIKSYEKDNLYLAEVAQMLIRNVNYEVPSTKKQIQKLEQIQIDLEKKITDYKKSGNTAKSEFNLLCKQLGISGQHMKQELAEKVKELPEIYEKVAKKTKCLGKAVEFYCAFVNYTLGRHHDDGCVPMIQYIIDKGNTTTYEWTYGEPPLSISEPPLNISFDNDVVERKTVDDAENAEIDFGEIDLKADVDLGGDVNLEAGGEIDWGDENVGEAAPADIDYNISLEESGIVVESAGHEGGIASGNEAYTILDNPNTRNDFINQLFELEAFLKLRLYEFNQEDSMNFLSFTQLQQSSSVLQSSTKENTEQMLGDVQVVLDEISDTKVQHLHNIKHSPKYVDILVSSLKQKLNVIDKMIASQNAVREKKEAAAEEAATLRPLLQLLIQRTKELQVLIEQDISKKYKNRVVHLTGGISTL